MIGDPGAPFRVSGTLEQTGCSIVRLNGACVYDYLMQVLPYCT
jgi:hypothetical protein